MIMIITAVFYVLCSAAVILLSCRAANKRIDVCRSSESENNEPLNAEKYRFSSLSYVMLFLIIAVSAVCGLRIGRLFCAGGDTADNVMTATKATVCYFVVLGAAVIDHKTRTIPNLFPILLVAARVVVLVIEFIITDSALNYLIGSVLAAALTFIIMKIANKISKSGIGGGDIKLLCGIALMCEIETVACVLMAALVLCILYSLVMALVKKLTFKDSLPFGPFIFFGYVLVCIFLLKKGV